MPVRVHDVIKLRLPLSAREGRGIIFNQTPIAERVISATWSVSLDG